MRRLKLFVLAILLSNFFIFFACHRPDTDQTRNSNESGSQTTHREITDPRARRRTLADTRLRLSESERSTS
jgi:hypothetical protein